MISTDVQAFSKPRDPESPCQDWDHLDFYQIVEFNCFYHPTKLKINLLIMSEYTLS